jgi:N-acetylglucosaminyldiphosphoundecaprenol N-acetyl-beta-D-mannosaminyltransferase
MVEPATSLAHDSLAPVVKTTAWPLKVNLFGVDISVTDYDQLVRAILDSAHARIPAIVSLFSVHSLISASDDADLCLKANAFQAIGPDGQPVRWAMNWLHKTNLTERVYGPETTLRICKAAADEGVAIYLYGSTAQVLEKLVHNLKQKFPELQIAGYESPPFRDLTPAESASMVARVHASGAGIFFIGLGCPKQDHFAYDYRNRLPCVQVAVGAAFDFHAGTKRTAPPWMQKRGLEWLFRLCEEPGRLWRRYLVTNSRYLLKLSYACVFGAKTR